MEKMSVMKEMTRPPLLPPCFPRFSEPPASASFSSNERVGEFMPPSRMGAFSSVPQSVQSSSRLSSSLDGILTQKSVFCRYFD